METLLKNQESLRSISNIGQIGIVVHNINAAAAFYSTFFNVRKWYRSKMVKYDVVYRDQPVDIEWDIVVGYSGRLQVEVIKILSGEQNIYHEVLGDNEGFHHFALMVNDLNKYLIGMNRGSLGFGGREVPKSLDRLHIDVLQRGTIHFAGGAVTQFAYLDTIPYCGFVIELVETRLWGINLGMPEWLVSVGRLLGSTESLS